MLDAITMERRGIPAAVVGVEKLIQTTGRGMARAQGFEAYPMATFAHVTGSLASVDGAQAIQAVAADLARQVEAILLHGGEGRG